MLHVYIGMYIYIMLHVYIGEMYISSHLSEMRLCVYVDISTDTRMAEIRIYRVKIQQSPGLQKPAATECLFQFFEGRFLQKSPMT